MQYAMLYYINFNLVSVSNHASLVLVHYTTELSYAIVTDHASAVVKPGNIKIISSKAQFNLILTLSP